MNRNQRRLDSMTRKNQSECKLRVPAVKTNGAEIEEVLPPRSRRQPWFKKPFVNRCCWVTPNQQSFGQLTGPSSPISPETETENALPDINTLSELHTELRKAYCNPTVEMGSQCVHPSCSFQKISASWQHVDDADEIERLLMRPRDEGTLTHYHSLPKEFQICEVPRVKVIAVKFAKYKKCNIEVRKIEEKVVCVEYDVLEGGKPAKPVQIMRAFFSVKPVHGDNENVLTKLPSTIKSKFNISTADLQKLNKKEVEIVDEKILENRPYLDDLRKILRRRQTSAKNPKRTLNLKTLYEMAKRELLELDTTLDTNVLTTEELLEIQNLILINCKSSAHGITRRTVGNKRHSDTSDVCVDAISRSLVAELLRVESVMQ